MVDTFWREKKKKKAALLNICPKNVARGNAVQTGTNFPAKKLSFFYRKCSQPLNIVNKKSSGIKICT